MPYPRTPSDLYLDVQQRASSTAIATAPTTLILPTVAALSGIQYDAATGIITLPESREYSTFLLLNVSTSGNRSIYAYVEVDTGSGFVPSRYSGRDISVGSQTDGQVNTVSRNYFEGGTRLRFMLWASGAATLTTVDLPGTTPGSVTAPGARLLIVA
jgi:hypothetical protein